MSWDDHEAQEEIADLRTEHARFRAFRDEVWRAMDQVRGLDKMDLDLEHLDSLIDALDDSLKKVEDIT